MNYWSWIANRSLTLDNFGLHNPDAIFLNKGMRPGVYMIICIGWCDSTLTSAWSTWFVVWYYFYFSSVTVLPSGHPASASVSWSGCIKYQNLVWIPSQYHQISSSWNSLRYSIWNHKSISDKILYWRIWDVWKINNPNYVS